VATLHLHFYLPIATHYSVDIFANYLRAVSSQIPRVLILLHPTVLTLPVLSWIFKQKQFPAPPT
jgi:hypothetical protein